MDKLGGGTAKVYYLERHLANGSTQRALTGKGDDACVKKKAIFSDIKRRISKEKQKGLMKNNPLKPDDYIQQF